MSKSFIGAQLDEYRLESVLGRGNMACVYLAMDTNLKRPAAVKVIDNDFREDAEYLMRFRREAQAIAQLDHPHIVKIYRYGETMGVPYMAMQYVEGVTLAALLDVYRKQNQTIEPGEAVQIVREIGLALDYAHSKGVIHRDIKPQNIMLDKQGNVILTDFGLALLTEIGTRGEIFGSPHYIAPEQALSSASVVPQSDLYSLGVILYEMFTGHLPFTGKTPLEIALMHISDRPCPPMDICPDMLPELNDLILKMLSKKPQDRYRSGAALTDALAQVFQFTMTGSLLRRPKTLAIKVPRPRKAPARKEAQAPLPVKAAPSKPRKTKAKATTPEPPQSAPTLLSRSQAKLQASKPGTASAKSPSGKGKAKSATSTNDEKKAAPSSARAKKQTPTAPAETKAPPAPRQGKSRTEPADGKPTEPPTPSKSRAKKAPEAVKPEAAPVAKRTRRKPASDDSW